MNALKNMFTRRPFGSVVVILVFFILSRYALIAAMGADYGADVWVKTIHRYVSTAIIIGLLIGLRWGEASGVTLSIGRWRRFWWLAMLPISLLALINLSDKDFSTMTFGVIPLVAWLTENIGIGLFEEVLLRGLCFYILYRAWGQTRGGIFKAAIVQAVLFGLVHYVNMLGGRAFMETSAQVLWASLLGIGFAGVVAFSRTVWPAVFAHAAIDGLSSLDEYFGSANIIDPVADKSLEDVITIVVVVLIAATLPGIWLLFKAELHPEFLDEISSE